MYVDHDVRWGVIGCGQIAVDKSLPGLLAAKHAQLVAIADPLASRRALAVELSARAGAPVRQYAEYHDLLADPSVDAVYISLPTGMHGEAVHAAARTGKAILCEKPMGRSAAEVREMVRATKASGVPLMTAYMSRFSDVFQEAVRLLREKKIGQVTFTSAHFSYPALQPYPPGAPGGWRWTDAEGGGPLLDIGVYLAFGLREMLGDRISHVSSLNCDTVAPPGLPVRDSTVAWFRTESGVPGTFVTTFSHMAVQIAFYGTAGSLVVKNCFNQTPGGRLECHTLEGVHVLDTTTDPDLPHFDNYRREFEHFSQALQTGLAHQPSADDVLADALLLDALKQGQSASLCSVPTTQSFLQNS